MNSRILRSRPSDNIGKNPADAIKILSDRLPLASFPLRKRARVDPEFLGKLVLSDTQRLPVVHQSLCHAVTIRERVKAEESDHSSHVVDAGKCGVALLPVDDRHRVAPNDFCDIPLAESKIKPALADHLSNRLWTGRVAGLLCKVWAYEAPNPPKRHIAKRHRIPGGCLDRVEQKGHWHSRHRGPGFDWPERQPRLHSPGQLGYRKAGRNGEKGNAGDGGIDRARSRFEAGDKDDAGSVRLSPPLGGRQSNFDSIRRRLSCRKPTRRTGKDRSGSCFQPLIAASQAAGCRFHYAAPSRGSGANRRC